MMVPPLLKPSYEELRQENVKLRAALEKIADMVNYTSNIAKRCRAALANEESHE